MAMAALTDAEARPESEPEKATMQTSSGAGLGMARTVRSTAKAAIVVAAASTGPAMVRLSNCMPTLLLLPAQQVQAAGLTDRCVNAEVSAPLLKEAFIRWQSFRFLRSNAGEGAEELIGTSSGDTARTASPCRPDRRPR